MAISILSVQKWNLLGSRNSYFILKTFNYVLNVSIENLDNKKYICIKGENRGTNDMGNDTNFITKKKEVTYKEKRD